MVKICPGLWGGRLPLPLPVSCRIVHVTLGVLAGYTHSWILALVFYLYQTTEQFALGYRDSVGNDLLEFTVGFLSGYLVRQLEGRL